MTNTLNVVQNYIYHLGLFWQNFNNLELHLRIYLNKKNGNDGFHVKSCLNMQIGEETDDNAITDYKSFRELCKSFNAYQLEEDKIDFKIFIELRDALAHGRISGDIHGNMSVIKYSKPKNGKVTVEYKSILSTDIMIKMNERIGQIGMDISLKGGAN
jgi:hypothetical protein